MKGGPTPPAYRPGSGVVLPVLNSALLSWSSCVVGDDTSTGEYTRLPWACRREDIEALAGESTPMTMRSPSLCPTTGAGRKLKPVTVWYVAATSAPNSNRQRKIVASGASQLNALRKGWVTLPDKPPDKLECRPCRPAPLQFHSLTGLNPVHTALSASVQ